MFGWYKIVEWFTSRTNRQNLILSFNKSSQESFILGTVPVLLKSSIARGCSQYKHSYSDWLYSGFRIKALSGRELNRSEMLSIGSAILADDILVRRLVVCGFDTLEVHDNSGEYGLKWQLKSFITIGS